MLRKNLSQPWACGDLVVIDGGEIILVVPKKLAQEVRKVVEQLKKEKLGVFL